MGDLHIAPWNKLLKITLVKEHRKLKERERVQIGVNLRASQEKA